MPVIPQLIPPCIRIRPIKARHGRNVAAGPWDLVYLGRSRRHLQLPCPMSVQNCSERLRIFTSVWLRAVRAPELCHSDWLTNRTNQRPCGVVVCRAAAFDIPVMHPPVMFHGLAKIRLHHGANPRCPVSDFRLSRRFFGSGHLVSVGCFRRVVRRTSGGGQRL